MGGKPLANLASSKAISRLPGEGKILGYTRHCIYKHLNTVIKTDSGTLKRVT